MICLAITLIVRSLVLRKVNQRVLYLRACVNHTNVFSLFLPHAGAENAV